jgi:hypothetical protein
VVGEIQPRGLETQEREGNEKQQREPTNHAAS